MTFGWTVEVVEQLPQRMVWGRGTFTPRIVTFHLCLGGLGVVAGCVARFHYIFHRGF